MGSGLLDIQTRFLAPSDPVLGPLLPQTQESGNKDLQLQGS